MYRILLFFLLLQVNLLAQERNYSTIVNPFIGTGGHGHTYPGAVAPFGMIQPSPDTRLEGWDGCSGYHYNDNTIYGFSQTHLSGTGVSDLGDLLIMPTIQAPQLNLGDKGYDGYKSIFSHKNEKAHAGYYEVLLDQSKIKTKITASTRVAHYQFLPQKKSDSLYLVIDLKHRDEVLDFSINIIDNQNINGKRISKAWAQEQHFYYHLSSNQPFKFIKETKDKQKMLIGLKYTDDFQIKIGISQVSEANAQLNMQAEIPHWKWDITYTENQKTWQKELSRIDFEGTKKEQDTIFYTALYHNMVVPNIAQDVNGDFRSTDLQVHNDTSFTYYSVFSLWDTYRATHALYTIIMPSRVEDFVKSLLAQYQYGGKLPMWELAGNYTGCMIGYHSASVISEAYLKNITNFDTRFALKAMIGAAEAQELGKPFYNEKGFLEVEDEHESVSKLLEYAYDDYAIGVFAAAIGDEQTAHKYLKKSKAFMHLFNPKNKFIQPKMNGKFIDFDPAEVNFHYTEANGWQYTFYMPHDIIQYVKLQGEMEDLESQLDALFADTSKSGRTQVDITGLIGQYAHGNEPSHHIAHCYNFTNTPSKTQYYTTKILDEFYTTKPDGLIGNEDCGQMSAWYILNSMGIYSFVPASKYYTITTPIAKKAIIHLEGGSTFDIYNQTTGDKNNYIQNIIYDGTPLKSRYILHDQIIYGGTINFKTGDAPADEDFKFHQLPTQKVNENIVPVPFFEYENSVFKDSLRVSLGNVYDNAVIYYRENLNEGYKKYKEPFYIKEAKTIYAYAQLRSRKSTEVDAQFNKMAEGIRLVSVSEYSSQYNGGHKNALIDGIRSIPNFRSGLWQGFYDQDMEVIIEVDEKRNIDSVAVGLIQDVKSWIWFPKSIEVYTSKNGEKYTQSGNYNMDVPNDKYGSIQKDFIVKLNKNKKTKFIKIIAKYPGIIPDWHPGKGLPCFIFADEIIIY